MDQNWYTNNATGSPPYKIKHSYHDGPGGGVKYFVRPPYHPEKSTPAPKPEDDSDNNEKIIKSSDLERCNNYKVHNF